MKRTVDEPKAYLSKLEQIKSREQTRTQIGDEKENKKVNESKYGTEKEKNLQIFKEVKKQKLKPVEQKKEEKIQTKKKLQYLYNHQYHEIKDIKNNEPRKVSAFTHRRQGDIVRNSYEVAILSKTDSGRRPELFSSQYTKQTTRKNVTYQPMTKITTKNFSNSSRTNKATNETTTIQTNTNKYKINMEVKDSKKNCLLKNIKSKYVIKEMMNFLPNKRFLNIIKYSKEMKKVLDVNINDYNKYLNWIEIEIIPKKKFFLVDLLILIIMKNITIFILMIIKKKKNSSL